MAKHGTVGSGPAGGRRVALVIETSLAPGREMLRGVARYVREHGPWATFWEPRGLEESVHSWLGRWRWDGVIARVQTRQIADAVLGLGVPVVDILGRRPTPGMPLVHTDDAAIGQLGADHLLGRGFRQLAFYGWANEPWSRGRSDAFAARSAGAGRACAVLEVAHGFHERSWDQQAQELAGWVRGLPKPVGLMLCTDQCGPLAMEACRRAGAVVPDDVAVLGVDNDEAVCEVSDPPLSSVWPDHDGVGYRAAAVLDGLMRARQPGGDGPTDGAGKGRGTGRRA
ncbi:MAG: transcriptional regulator, partial [Phycisphaerales bacterium]|nr:transcriptional regulator [Phycisphaerales bacterium]